MIQLLDCPVLYEKDCCHIHLRYFGASASNVGKEKRKILSQSKQKALMKLLSRSGHQNTHLFICLVILEAEKPWSYLSYLLRHFLKL